MGVTKISHMANVNTNTNVLPEVRIGSEGLASSIFASKIFNTVGQKNIFTGNCNRLSFAIIISAGASFTLLTAIDENGTLLEDDLYVNYTENAQGTIEYPGRFGINIISVGTSGVEVQYRIF